MKQSIIYLLAMLVSLNACKKVNGDGPVITEQRQPGSFTAVHYAIPGTLTFETGNEPRLEIRAQQNILDVIETFVSGDELRIRLREHTVIRSYEPIEVHVYGSTLNGLHLSGSGSAQVASPVNTQRLWLESSGSGSISVMSLSANELETRISGSGSIRIQNGQVQTEKIKISGSGQTDLRAVTAKSAYTETSGSGDIWLWADEYLESEISGSGNVWYKGTPQIKLKVSGSGRVTPMQ
ncbi:head GIN domain-containing protein [Flavihumibacter petaseus]|uniref:Putative auto-transporter adhesin head GIN domain-containing protein n=1 Tax=Flavihumibacter petaseus NBRC 106054 TaxID=1220578 RepID=A0A0E9N1B8_9BACT|nr:head GIN domain-containing protein [Flavihumibacter petaseus]GAO43431.1 hypothetical protein FPE01S_02_05360 [Flavihumibacter petaseus NBRC 106054]